MVLTKTPICNFGEKAHDFDLKGIDGKSYNLKDCMGKNGILIKFICNHCPYVKAIIKDLVKEINDLMNFGINSVAIMSNDTKNYPDDSFENMKLFAEENNFNFPYLIDETQEVAKNMEQYARQIFLDIMVRMNFNIEEELESSKNLGL